MKIHLNQIPSGDTLHIEGEEDHDILDLHDPLARALGRVRYSLDVGLSGSGLFATGTLSVELELECVRCLTRFPYPLEIPNFATQIELPPTETVDLTDAIREDILLVLPPHPHCDWNSATTCAGVLEIQRIQEPEPASEPEGANPWATLDQFSKPKER
jgi:uncharacterized metal-binding protein YceD (DUF177 family)